MKLTIAFLITFMVCEIAVGQAPANRTVYDCNGNSKNIYATLATGKSVIIAHKGVDCSICRNSAAGWETWAAANSTNVEVWGAITYTYSASNFPTANMCTITQNWKSTYNWNSIFTFPDSNRLWYQGSSPRYFVYSAIDSSIVYQGSNSTLARSNAIAQSTVGIKKSPLRNVQVYVHNRQLTVKNIEGKNSELRIFNLQGQLVFRKNLNSADVMLDVSSFVNGIYILKLDNSLGSESRRLLLQ